MQNENIAARNVAQATIANGTKPLTAPVNLEGMRSGGVVFPAVFTGATVTVEVSADGTNFFPLYDNAGNAQTITPETSSACAIPAAAFAFPWLQLQSASNEGAARSLTICLAS
jgi:hypothetical protein